MMKNIQYSTIKIYIFVAKARLSFFTVNLILYVWDRQKNPHCSFDCFYTESMAPV